MFLEWLWRRHGEAGLWWYSNRMRRRAIVSARKATEEFDRLGDQVREAASVFDEFTEAMRKADMGGS